MKSTRLGPAGKKTPVVLVDGTYFALSPITSDIDGEFLSSAGIDAAAAAVESATLLPLADADALRIGAPIARPSAVVCIEMNYAAHAAESGSA